MKDKLPKSEKAKKQEEKQARGTFVACGRVVKGGAFYLNGAECMDGYWYYNATAYDDSGNDMYGKPVRWARLCECLLTWKRGATVEGKKAQPALDGKAIGPMHHE